MALAQTSTAHTARLNPASRIAASRTLTRPFPKPHRVSAVRELMPPRNNHGMICDEVMRSVGSDTRNVTPDVRDRDESQNPALSTLPVRCVCGAINTLLPPTSMGRMLPRKNGCAFHDWREIAISLLSARA